MYEINHMDWNTLFQSMLILFAIVNPIGSIPIFLELAGGMAPEARKKAFNMAVFTSAAILFFFLAAGKWILASFFRISLPDLMAAGGLLLLIIAIDHLIFGALVRGVRSAGQRTAHHIGAVPMACPILAGPGAMISIIGVLGITWVIFRFIDVVYRLLGEAVCLVLSKILCLFLAAIGIRLLMQGLTYYFR